MAEFQEVMKQAKRMCQSFGADCNGCKLHWRDGETLCVFVGKPKAWRPNKMTDAECVVMDWAASHPEPRYPSWKEWREKIFPDSTYKLCPKNFMSREDSGCDNQTSCIQCMDCPIPADIAEKLGIKPIGGKDNA